MFVAEAWRFLLVGFCLLLLLRFSDSSSASSHWVAQLQSSWENFSFLFFKHNILNTHYQVICSFLKFYLIPKHRHRGRERQRERDLSALGFLNMLMKKERVLGGLVCFCYLCSHFVCVLITQKAREICGSCFVVSCFFVLEWRIWSFCNNVKVLQFLCLLACDWCQVEARRNS